MLDERSPIRRRVHQPSFACLRKQRRVDLAKIVEIVGDTPAEQCCRIILQELQKFDDSIRVLIQPWNPHGPGEP